MYHHAATELLKLVPKESDATASFDANAHGTALGSSAGRDAAASPGGLREARWSESTEGDGSFSLPQLARDVKRCDETVYLAMAQLYGAG